MMEKFGRGQPVVRVEDLRLLTGQGRYVDDIAPSGALRAYVLRTQVAHGTIATLDVSAARSAPGVALVLTAADIEQAGVRLGMKSTLVTNRDGSKGAAPLRPLLAKDRVRFVGEAVAFIVAETLLQAKDAAELVELDIETLPAHVATAPGGPDIHPEAPGNVAFDFALGDGEAVAAALETAARVVSVEIPDSRIIVNSMEPRGCYAEPEGERLHVCVNGQGVWGPKGDLCYHLGMEAGDVRVTTPDVGGGFGMKGMTYPEMILVAHAARTLGRPVRWMSERTEAMLSDNGGRDLVTTATMGFDAKNRLTAYRVESVCNLGAYNSFFAQMIQTELFAKVMPGTYDMPAAELRVTGVYTNTTQIDAYRGAGRPEAIFVLERAMDQAARELGVDPWELRRTNFIRPDQFPYTSRTGVTYDVGDFARVLGRGREAADVVGFAARRAASEAAGKLRGLGLCYYIESILGDPSETATVVFGENEVEIHVGTQSNGQGHETVFAQFLADQTGMPADRIRVRQGDSDLIPAGGGTGGSRSVTTQTTATLGAVDRIVAAFSGFLEEEADATGVEWDGEHFRIPGSNETPGMLDVADRIRAAGRTELLRQSATTKLDSHSFPNGVHVAEVEIDPETGIARVDRYTVVDDLGNLVNPLLAAGQVHGGVAQGLGQVMMERVVHDADGQLLTATFMDYALPRADDMPWIGFNSEPVPSVNNPLGMKGCGEAGTVGALAAVTNAMADAMGPGRVEMPFTPERVWRMLQERTSAAA